MKELFEDVLRTILELERRGLKVSALSIAQDLGMNVDRVLSALEALEGRGLIQRNDQDRVLLTVQGRAEAEEVLRKHETVEGFFQELLGVKDAHAEAHALEHVISYPVLDLMERLRSQREHAVPLSQLSEGQASVIVFLDLSKQKVLDKVIGLGLLPNQEVKVTKKMENRLLILDVKGKKIAIDKELGDHIYGVVQ